MNTSFTTLHISDSVFTITKAYIKESLEFPFVCECEGFVETLNLSFHPKQLIDKFALLNINDPYSQSLKFDENSRLNMLSNLNPANLKINNLNPANSSLENLNSNLVNSDSSVNLTNSNPAKLNSDFTNLSSNLTNSNSINSNSNSINPSLDNSNLNSKSYKGIISAVHYLGQGSSSNSSLNSSLNSNPALNSNLNANDLSSKISTLNTKHFFSFTLNSVLVRMSLNKSNRIFSYTNVISVLKSIFKLYGENLGKNVDFSHILTQFESEEIITQYQESDLAFITRIAHNKGIYFYEDETSIIFYDLALNNRQDKKELLYNPKLNNALNEECISAFLEEGYLNAKSFDYMSVDLNHPLNFNALNSAILKQDFDDEFNENSSLNSSFNATNLNSNSSFNATNLNSNSNLNSSESLNSSSNSSAQLDNFYKTHHYESAFSFTQAKESKESFLLKQQRHININETIKAKSNIFHLNLNEKVFIKQSPLKTPNANKERQDDFIIIANEQLLIDESALLNEGIKGQNSSLNSTLNSALNSSSNLINSALNSSLNSSQNPKQQARHYSNIISLLPSHIAFTPSLKSKPKAPLNTQGIVVGRGLDIESERNTIYTDEYGRVRVRLNAFVSLNEYQALQDSLNSKENSSENLSKENSGLNSSESLNSNNDNLNLNSSKENSSESLNLSNENTNSRLNSNSNNENLNLNSSKENSDLNSNETLNSQSSENSSFHFNSPFLRVASSIASEHSGLFHIPRVGDEVIISYLDEDIDKPFVSASLYNKINTYLNKDKDHQTSLSSKTIGKDEEGYNEISLFNEKNKEQIQITAQKDYDELIKNNFSQKIENDKSIKVKGQFNENIDKTHTQNILLAKNVNIGGEFLTNVALSKDTVVGLNHSLNVGGESKIRIANNSSEFVGGDKESQIQGRQSIIIQDDEIKNVKGNVSEVVEGAVDVRSEKEFNISTQSQLNFNADDNILLFGRESTSLETQKELSFIADNTDIENKSNFTNTAGNEIIHQVGDTSIVTKGDRVIIKVGGVEVVIDSNGLLVKGGEIKAE